MVRMARALRLLKESAGSAFWYKRAIEGFSSRGQGLRALALAKELISVAPDDHSVLLEMARLYARHQRDESGSGRGATPLNEPEEMPPGGIPPDITADSAKTLVVLDDAAEVERLEPAMPAPREPDSDDRGLAGKTEETRKATAARTESDAADSRSPSMASRPAAVPPPPPPEAFLVAEEDEKGEATDLATDPAWAAELASRAPAEKASASTPSTRSGPARDVPPEPSLEQPRATQPRATQPRATQPPRERLTTTRPPLEQPPKAGPLPPVSAGEEVLEHAKLGDLPLLSSLGEKAFVTISSAMRPVALQDGEVLFRAGDDARSFFIIAQGGVEARVQSRGGQRALATLGEGEVLGLFGLYTGRKRNATAVAVGPTVAFEITDRVLAGLVRDHPASKKPLALFYRRRLLEISLGRSPLFQDLPREKRLAIVDRFEQRKLAPREHVVSPGQVTLGLFLVMRGLVLVKTRDSGRVTVKARMERGQFFGCISALTGMPTLASAECEEESVLAILPHRTFGELLDLEPELAALPRRLRDEGVLITPTLFVGGLDAVCPDQGQS